MVSRRSLFISRVLVALALAACGNSPVMEPPPDSDEWVEQLEGRRILWIGAHPDDEVTLSPLLGEACVFRGASCTLLVATRGENHCLISGLCGEIRSEEMRASAQLLGARLIQWSLPNRGPRGSVPARIATWSGSTGSAEQLVGRLVQVLDDLQPEILITFDPRHGTTCHVEHRAIAALAIHALRERPQLQARLWLQQSRVSPDSVIVPVLVEPGLLTYDANRLLPGSQAASWSFLPQVLGIHRSQYPEHYAPLAEQVPQAGRRAFLLPRPASADLAADLCHGS
jgi:LmbE family N-acetylglucosaminyl deacetylase